MRNNLRGGTWDELDHTRWYTGLLQQLVNYVVGIRRSRRWLPQYDIADESRDTWEITTDSGKVEWRNRKDESFESTVLDPAENVRKNKRC